MAPPDLTIVSWLPFYHDMGLVLGICAPILGGYRAELTSPVAFLERPARWMRALAENPRALSAAPNFAFDMAARKTTDSDLAGLDLGGVRRHHQRCRTCRAGHAATLRRSVRALQLSRPHDASVVRLGGGDRLRRRPAPGVSQSPCSQFRRRRVVRRPCRAVRGRHRDAAGPLRTCRSRPRCGSSTSRPAASAPQDVVGEIWVHGDNVAVGYWGKSPEEQQCFGATLVDPSPGTPERPVAADRRPGIHLRR